MDDYFQEYSAGPEEQAKGTEQQDIAVGSPQEVQPTRRYPERECTAPKRHNL